MKPILTLNVCYQGLAINPQTSSPEILLTVARVAGILPGLDCMTDKSLQNIDLRYLQRPGAGRAALAFGLNGAAGFNDQEQVESHGEIIEWRHFLTEPWRLIEL